MSSTRLNETGEFRAERGLSHPAVCGIAIGAQIVVRIAARLKSEVERTAMLWLCQFAHLLDLSADQLSDELDLDPRLIRECLNIYDADRSKFTPAVEKMRKEFEAGLDVPRFERKAIPPFKSRVFREAYARLADTKIRRKVANAVKFTEGNDGAQLVEVIGETRLGKTVCGAQEFFKRLDHSAWLVVPSANDEMAFLRAVALALGCSVATNDKARHLIGKIESTIGPRGIRKLFVDEAHRALPSNLTGRPKRLDYLRDWWEYHGLSVIFLATPQFTERLNECLASDSIPWETGQWIGRVQVFDLPDTPHVRSRGWLCGGPWTAAKPNS